MNCIAVGAWAVLGCLFAYVPAQAQTTQGIILGTVTDSVTGAALPDAKVVCVSVATGLAVSGAVNAGGEYVVASLSPGAYRMTVNAAGYQSQQARGIELPVSARLELNFRVRPLYNVWETGQYRSLLLPESRQSLGMYGPDVDTSRNVVFNANRGDLAPLETSRSDVISRIEIRELPLEGRDVYTMLLLLPGVTSDTATARGLGFSVNGQRPSSSNYLLDGVQNNNALVTGPLSAATPEFVGEYRVSESNYSAEYGRTSGFVANAVTRSGTDEWHGQGFFYFENDRLNANGFQENANGIARPPFTEIQPGLTVGGPLKREKLFLFGGVRAVRSQGRGDPGLYGLPTSGFLASADPTSFAAQLFRATPEATPIGATGAGLALIAPVSEFRRLDTLLRLDYTLSAGQQLFARAAVDQAGAPELTFSPYRQFGSEFRQSSVAIAVGLTSRLGARAQNEIRVSRTGDRLSYVSPHSGVATLEDDEVLRANGQLYRVFLPGSLNQYDYRNRGRNWEVVDDVGVTNGRHAWRFGASFFERQTDLRLSLFPTLYFPTLGDVNANQPSFLSVQVDAFAASNAAVTPDHEYRYRQFSAFAQDSFHVNSRMTLDYGLRWEYLGAPVNVGAQKDALINLARPGGIAAAIAGAIEAVPAGTADQAVFTARPSNWAVRAAFAYDLTGRGKTLLRGAYGTFYDPLFDNEWENVIQNRYTTQAYTFANAVPGNSTLAQLEAAGQAQSSTALIPALAFQSHLRSPRTQSVFVGLQQQLRPGVQLEVDGLASRTTQLITTDEVNRQFSVAPTPANAGGYLNPNIANYINYRANQGTAQYTALVAALQFRERRVNGQVSYTWSHALDNQSEPLAGTFFDFNTFASTVGGAQPYVSSFTRQFASGADRGNSDFDQRQNLVFFAAYQIPQLWRGRAGSWLRDWTVAGLGAARSGLPYSVYSYFDASQFPPEIFVNQRANVLNAGQVYASGNAPGGKVLLNAAAFAMPGPNMLGNSGRNAFRGPGLFNADLSVGRTFTLLERLRLVARADAYNFLNHANLNNPDSFLQSPTFGVAQYGRGEMSNGFPLLAPLAEAGRQVQVLLRLEF